MSGKKQVENLSSTRARASMSTIDKNSTPEVHCKHSKMERVENLRENPRNYNKHSDKQIALLAKNIRHLGWRHPIIVSGLTDFIVAGHARLQAAKLLNLSEVPVDVQPFSSETEELAYLIADNRIAELAEVDNAMLSGLLADETIFDGFDMDLTGFDGDALADLMPEPETDVDAEPQIDKAEELREKWGVETGQLWQLGDHRLLCGDSTKAEDVERVMGGEKADCIIADPPYGMRLDADFSGMKNNLKMAQDKGLKNGKKYANVIGDHEDFDAAPVISACGDPESQFWFGADYYSSTLLDTEHSGAWLVWDKRLDESADKMFGSCFELCWSKRKCKRDIIRIKWAGVFGTEKEPQRGRQHPNQKPVALLVDIASRTEGLIVDPFSGSGTTIIACEQLGRKCRAIEISPAYVAVAIQRWADATGKEPVLLERTNG
jgi:DNA modification methylase